MSYKTPAQTTLQFAIIDDFQVAVKQSFWSDSLIFPAYFTAISILVALAHVISSSVYTKKLLGRAVSSPHDELSADYEPSPEYPEDRKILRFQIARFFSCLLLLALQITALAINSPQSNPSSGHFALSDHEWLDFAMIFTYTYVSAIAFAVVSVQPNASKVANFHLISLLFGTWVVFAYRDFYPFATFTLKPLDLSEGWLMYTKLGVLSIAAVVIPLAIPNQYIPLDPKDPAAEPNPEQTASWFSWLLYFFLDSIILQASRTTHLPLAEFPPVADYDLAKNLIKASFPYMDPTSPKAKKHLVWGILRVFRPECVTICLVVAAQSLVALLRPVAVNRLLSYLETGGEDAFYRPWVWVFSVFLVPFLGSVLWQWYGITTTRSFVGLQAIITQLVFEHALRVRMKVDTTEPARSASVSATPETASVIGESEISEGSIREGNDSASSTVLGVPSSSGSKHTPASTTESRAKPIDSEQEKENFVGKLNNLISTDLENIVEGRDFILIVVGAPLQIGLGMYYLYLVLGWSALVGLAAMVILFPIPGYIAKVMQNVQTQKMKLTDSRVQSVTEIMSTIRMIKLFGWGSRMMDRVSAKRDQELKLQRQRRLLELGNDSMNILIPLFVMVITFACYTLIMKENLNASRVFSSMAVFDMLRNQLNFIFMLIPPTVQAKVSIDRVEDFLRQTEMLDEFAPNVKDSITASHEETDNELIGFRNAAFTWSNDPQTPGTPGSSRRNFKLRINEELIFKKGKINLVVGPTGCGKTSLLMALLSELHFVPSGPDSWFNLPRKGGVSYAAQESWVQNQTIKENILFGSPFDEVRYKKVIEQCGLVRDLTLFEAGDDTEVGEKGLSLSGGQKARVTLARAIYSSAEIILLDDVLAALDVHTARWVVEKCLSGDLVLGRTVILVTHNVAMTNPIADFVVSLGTDGRILSQGTLSTALKLNKALYKEVQEEKLIERGEEELDAAVTAPDIKGDGKLIMAEEISEGRVSWNAYKLFFSAMGGSNPAAFWILAFGGLVLEEFAMVFQTWYLSYWAAQYEKALDHPVPVVWYLSTYSLLLAAVSIVFIAAIWIFISGSLRASRVIHKKLIDSILGTTLRWLDSTPVARVISRCTQDIQAVDGPITTNFQVFSEITVAMLMKFAAVVFFTPIFLSPGLAVAALGAWCGSIYLKAQLCVKREMSNARSPVLGHFGAAVAGIVSIRAYNAQKSFKTESLKRIDNYTRAARTFYSLNRWISLRVDVFGSLFSAALAAYLVYRPTDNNETGRAAQAGFSINMAVGFSSMILWWVRFFNDFEVAANSLERIQQYIMIEQEPKSTEAGVPPAYWPASGDIRVEHLDASYTPGGTNVLHDVSFHISSGERVGVVGRTGSGKSSLTLSMLRCIATSGDVYYDHLDTRKVNLDILRSNITIIPQIPELLSGTLRENLDPFDQFDDLTLNAALRAAGLFSIQTDADEDRLTLETAIGSGGGNLSVGQRQIIALARAIVRRSKLLILDEATSAIDYATDAIIQESLRHGLDKDVTLFTIAHRLQTIMDADKIMVLDAGRVVEFGKPSELLGIPGGRLRSLVDESGDKEMLYQMANFQL